ncbi:MAG: AAA family ATPase [Planctomycetales bacterium]|nr:AAA family ATPase [Planctomycetales bacterium]
MATESHSDIVPWLSRPDSYSHRPERVDHIETHISHVFIAGELVYKLKKPIKYDFLDFTTLPAREHACREEVRLNTRLAPNTYLGVLPIIRDTDGKFRLRGPGEIVDWLVEMRRLPTELTLDELLRRGELLPGHIDRLAATLARFYRSLTPLSVTAEKYIELYLAHVRGNQGELLAVQHHLAREVVERVHGFQLQLLRLCPELFADRVRAGRIVDGHGDLRPEHICFSDPIAIFDCIEFSPEFRRIDVADELAFLAAECDFLGAEWVGPQLLAAYQQQSDDQPAAVLFDFYKSYRACVRAKVAALRADQLQGVAQETAAAEARRHLALADQYAAPWLRPLVFAVGGLSGTGKTTLAKGLADALGADLLRTDVVRQEVFGAGAHAAQADSGIYRRESRELVYDELFRQAAALHAENIPVVLDGTFSSLSTLAKAQEVASQPQALFLAIECVCRPEVAHQRISQRQSAGRDASDARPEIHDFQRKSWEDWPAETPQVCINTELPLTKQVEQVIAALRSRFGPCGGRVGHQKPAAS